jgi:hypothetical protein
VADTFTSHPRHGAKSGITTSATPIVASSKSAQSGVLIRADKANTDTVYIGQSTVTAGTTDATDGFPLYAGDFVFIPVIDAALIYAIAASGTQRVFWLEN